MAQAKFRQYYQQMMEQNKELFAKFKKIPASEPEFHQVGQEVVDLVRDFDRRLCAAMGKGVYSTYSQKLSEKFWDLVRSDFPAIDLVGVKIKKRPTN